MKICKNYAVNPAKHPSPFATYRNSYYKDEDELKAALSEYIIIKKASKTMPAAYAYVKNWFLSKYKEEFEAYEQEQKAKEAAAATDENDELNALLAIAN